MHDLLVLGPTGPGTGGSPSPAPTRYGTGREQALSLPIRSSQTTGDIPCPRALVAVHNPQAKPSLLAPKGFCLLKNRDAAQTSREGVEMANARPTTTVKNPS